jgi:hypothetical protein
VHVIETLFFNKALMGCFQASAIPFSLATKNEGKELLLHFFLLAHICFGEKTFDTVI